ncbi:MAG: polysaccharide deacetylase family protein [Pseudomonadota bacterium]
MSAAKTRLIRHALSAMTFTGLDRLYAQLDRELGMILTFHRVESDQPDERTPNAHLTVHPGFLDDVISLLKRRNIEIVSMDEARRRIAEPIDYQRFAALTFDDGYRDNLKNALPVLESHRAPATLYIAPGLVEGTASLWWEGLGQLVAQQQRFVFAGDRGPVEFDCTSMTRKQESFTALVKYLISAVPEHLIQQRVAELCWLYKIDVAKITKDAIMTWNEIRQMVASPLVTAGAHTMNHYHLARLPQEHARDEIYQSSLVLEAELGRKPKHLAFPYGYHTAAARREFDIARDLKFVTAVTTRPGMIFAEHGDHLTALPRMSMNGLYQSGRYIGPLTSGLPSRMKNRLSKLDVG